MDIIYLLNINFIFHEKKIIKYLKNIPYLKNNNKYK